MSEAMPDAPSETDDNDLTAFDVEAVPSAAEPDDLDGSAEEDNEGLEHDPANPEIEDA